MKKLYGKIFLKLHIECMTGLHIGDSNNKTIIGGLDAAVVRDYLTTEPYIPGSSLKGKMRSLFEKEQSKGKEGYFGTGKIRRHECNKEDCQVCRLFGKVKDGSRPSRILVRDAYLINADVLKKIDIDMTEIKWENTINRINATAQPRQIERVPKGAKFETEIVYNVEIDQKNNKSKEMIVKDVENIISILNLLQDDGLGGNISRGYGKIKIRVDNFDIKAEKDYFPSAVNGIEKQEIFNILSQTEMKELKAKLKIAKKESGGKEGLGDDTKED